MLSSRPPVLREGGQELRELLSVFASGFVLVKPTFVVSLSLALAVHVQEATAAKCQMFRMRSIFCDSCFCRGGCHTAERHSWGHLCSARRGSSAERSHS